MRVVLVGLIIMAVGLHVVGALSLWHVGLEALSAHTPIEYLVLGLCLALVGLKLYFVVGHRHKETKQEARDML